MSIPIASLLGLVFVLSEMALAKFKRAKRGEARDADRGSLLLLWVVIVLAVNLAYFLPSLVPSLGFGPRGVFVKLGAALFGAGLMLRWYAIIYLGRFFTVNVAISRDHRLIDTGPYRLLRHPSYTGALVAFLGLGLCIGNWASLAAMLIPTLAVFSWRIRVEEQALLAALGEPYLNYMRRTKRLVPAIY
jgi:protein-S-isoprenylcysteine O-methyltransferase